MLRNFPGSPLVKNPGANAGNMGSISGLGTKITHAARQLTLCIRLPTLNSRACELQLLKPDALQMRSHSNEEHAQSLKSSPMLLATRQSPCAAMKSQCSQK